MNFTDLTNDFPRSFDTNTFGGPNWIFTAANASITLAAGDVLVVGILSHIATPGGAAITPPGDWNQDAYWTWTDSTDGNDYAMGFYSRVWTLGDSQSTYTATWLGTPFNTSAWCLVSADTVVGPSSVDSDGQFDVGTEAAGSYLFPLDSPIQILLNSASGGYYPKDSWIKYLIGAGALWFTGLSRANSFDSVEFFRFSGSFDFGSSPAGFQGNVVAAGVDVRPFVPTVIRASQRVSQTHKLAVT